MTKDLKTRIENIYALDAARTQGEWFIPRMESNAKMVFLGEKGCIYASDMHTQADADFIGNAPSMVSIIRELEAENKRLREALEIIASEGKGQYNWSETKIVDLARKTLNNMEGK